MGVPRVWEKIQAKMVAAGAKAPPMRKKIAAWARKTGLAGGYAEQARRRAAAALPDREEARVRQGPRAPRARSRARLRHERGADLEATRSSSSSRSASRSLEVYGMSECTGPATYSPPDDYRTGKCGIVLPGAEMQDRRGRRDLHARPARLQGLLEGSRGDDGTRSTPRAGCTPATSATIDTDGFLQITDRKKDLLITAGGENIAPQVLEGQLKAIPVVGQAVVIGDRRKYLAALVTLDPDA